MGPSDPFSDAPPRAAPPPRADGLLPTPEPRPPAPRRVPAVAVGAALGLAFGLSTVIWGLGPAIVVLLCTALGAAAGVLARAMAGGGLDVGAAWRALRRR